MQRIAVLFAKMNSLKKILPQFLIKIVIIFYHTTLKANTN